MMITNLQGKDVVISDAVIDGIDPSDYPDFCDAFLDYALVDGEIATEEQLDELGTKNDLMYELTINTLI